MGVMGEAFAESLRNSQIEAADSAAVELGRHYASLIDQNPELVVEVGPKLLAVLTALRMTPAARVTGAGKGWTGWH